MILDSDGDPVVFKKYRLKIGFLEEYVAVEDSEPEADCFSSDFLPEPEIEDCTEY